MAKQRRGRRQQRQRRCVHHTHGSADEGQPQRLLLLQLFSVRPHRVDAVRRRKLRHSSVRRRSRARARSHSSRSRSRSQSSSGLNRSGSRNLCRSNRAGGSTHTRSAPLHHSRTQAPGQRAGELRRRSKVRRSGQ